MKLILPLFFGLALSSANVSATEAPVDFSQAYQAYQAAVASNNKEQMLISAAQSYRLGLAKYGPTSINSANLALNWTNAMLRYDERAEPLLKEYFPVFSSEYGEQGLELIDVYFAQARHSTKPRQYYQQALDISLANHGKAALKHGEILLQLLSQFWVNDQQQLNFANKLLKQVDEIVAANQLSNSKMALQAEFYRGKYARMAKKNSQAIASFEQVIAMTASLETSHPLALVSHAALVELFEAKGDSERATSHCQAIGLMQPWSDNLEQTPLYRVNPRYPKSAARMGKSGSAELSFDVDTNGFVTNIKVLNYKGHKGFVNSSKEAIAKWRYAPKFVNGQAVVASSRVRLDYSLNKPSH
ncbi:energy transducer TonB [uncultured Ferrimonas sp.]|uniref:energy transducer TonB n=1 Tax=uncultured Ferrimonas sp. TaxID=432640 RepID=UPI0026036C29|nr:energy transducer TonB [uncultured Ferrimonas sp.]